MDPHPRRPRIRLWVISLAFFAGGFVCRVAAYILVDNVAWSYRLEVAIQWYAYLAALVTWGAWLVLQSPPGRRGLGCLIGAALAVASFFVLISSVPK